VPQLGKHLALVADAAGVVLGVGDLEEEVLAAPLG
jgi:hypothetical protein